MDELTIEDKKYLSSKKAAKLTGYAKDYVGQLCREGRVEARLVGRNWYVLEDSIMEHRFGASPSTIEKNTDSMTTPPPASDEVSTSKNVVEYNWNPPVYTSEPSNSLPVENVPDVLIHAPLPAQSAPTKTEDANPQVLNDMQSAWQEWFSKQKESKKALPDASEMLLDAPESPASTEMRALEEEPVDTRLEEEMNPAYEESNTEISEEVPIYIKREITPTPHVIKKEQEYIEDRRVPLQDSQRYSSPKPQYKAQKAQKSPIQPQKVARSTYLLKVTMLSIAGIIVAITYLSISSKDATETGKGNTFTNYFTGVQTVKTSK